VIARAAAGARGASALGAAARLRRVAGGVV